MSRRVDRHLKACRLRGLYVDEDFERGHEAVRRLARGMLLTALVAALITTVAAIARPSAFDAVLAPSVMAPQTHRPDNSSHPRFRRTVAHPRSPRALV